MKCPKCYAPMDKASMGSVEIDRCSGCKGLWFDANELDELLRYDNSEMLDLGLASLGHAWDTSNTVLCPRCKVIPMKTENMLGHESVQRELCPQCLGSFLDAGEFTEIKSRSPLIYMRNTVARLRA